MTKRELIEALEALECPDDTEVNMQIYTESSDYVYCSYDGKVVWIDGEDL